MKIWQCSVMALLLASTVYSLGCRDCGEPDPIESGQYTILDDHLGVLNWLAVAQLDINRETETTTLRYTREGTTYEVRFTLVPR